MAVFRQAVRILRDVEGGDAHYDFGLCVVLGASVIRRSRECSIYGLIRGIHWKTIKEICLVCCSLEAYVGHHQRIASIEVYTASALCGTKGSTGDNLRIPKGNVWN